MTSSAISSADRASRAFIELCGSEPEGVWSAPGRVNLIGEHTDYNDGLVLPFALPHRISVAAASRRDGLLSVTTIGDNGRPQRASPVRVDDLQPGQINGWASYPIGVAWVLREHGLEPAADLVIAGDVPAGAGLSSSAALQCAVAVALLGLAGRELGPDLADRAEVAHWTQRAENEFVGVPSGVLDHTAAMCCVRAHALFLDVRTAYREQVPFDTTAGHLEVLVIDTRVRHALADSSYADRRRACEHAAEILGVPALRDIRVDDLEPALHALPHDLRPLVSHVVTENARVAEAVRSLRAQRLCELGPLLTASHVSLRDDYRVSCVELDVAVKAALAGGALGARMTGAGFGGSVIALVPSDARPQVERAVTAAFARRKLTRPRLFAVTPAAGAGRDT